MSDRSWRVAKLEARVWRLQNVILVTIKAKLFSRIALDARQEPSFENL